MGTNSLPSWKFVLRRYRAPLAALCACALCVVRGAAYVSSAGEYQIESSVVDNGGGSSSGGAYTLKASAAQRLSREGPGLASAGEYVNRTGFYNPPRFTFQKTFAAVLPFNSGNAAFSLPAGAVDKEVFDITLNKDPVGEPLHVSPGSIGMANSGIIRNSGDRSALLPGNIAELVLFDEQDAWDRPFLRPGRLALRYRDADGDGILDGSNPPVRTSSMRVWALDEEVSMWAKLPAAAHDSAERSLSVELMTPGVYSLLGMLDESVKDTYAYPVPYRPYGPAAGEGPGQTGSEAGGITFTNVPQTGDIEIYTLDGRLVRKLEIPGGLVLPKIKWDVRTAAGGRAASGVYIWRVASGSNSKTGKLMVIW